MEKIAEECLINLIKVKFPRFLSYWESYVNHWGEENGIIIQMFPFTDYVTNAIKSQNQEEIKEIFDFVEFLMCNGDQSVQNAIATGFLEELLNKDPDEIQFIKFSQYLGKETIRYLRAWNEFNGTITKGL